MKLIPFDLNVGEPAYLAELSRDVCQSSLHLDTKFLVAFDGLVLSASLEMEQGRRLESFERELAARINVNPPEMIDP